MLSRELLSLRSATGEQGARDRCPKGARLSTALDGLMQTHEPKHMGTSIRHILVDENDEVFRLSNSLFQRLWDQSPSAVLPQFVGRRLRWAEAAVQLQDRKPVRILRVVFCYVYFDREGRLNRERVMQDSALMLEAGLGNIAAKRTGSVIDASSRFAARRRDYEAIWKPSPDLARQIYDVALDSKEFKRL